MNPKHVTLAVAAAGNTRGRPTKWAAAEICWVISKNVYVVASFQLKKHIMNTQAFLALFFSALFACVSGFGSLTTVVYNGALTIPLLAATTGTFGTALAVLGVLKLGAAALLLAASLRSNDDQGYEYRKRRYQRSAVEGVTSNPDALFSLVASMDSYGCGKSLVCELEAKSSDELLEDEVLILSLFRCEQLILVITIFGWHAPRNIITWSSSSSSSIGNSVSRSRKSVLGNSSK
jgi:hypothetical protein